MQVVKACEAVDGEVTIAKELVVNAQREIIEKVSDIYRANFDLVEIDKLSLKIQYGLNEAMNENGIGYKIFRMNEIINRRMFDSGNMKYANISAEEFEQYKLHHGDILFNRTNSIEHVGKTGIFLLDGDYCFASYLIRIIIDKKLAAPFFVNLMMNSDSFQKEAKSKAAKAINQANINSTVMRNIKIPVPPIAKQEKLVAEVETLDTKIAEAQNIIDGAMKRKQAIMKQFL